MKKLGFSTVGFSTYGIFLPGISDFGPKIFFFEKKAHTFSVTKDGG